LVELLAVITVLAILTGLVVGMGWRAVESGRVARARAELAALAVALEAYKRQYGDYPRTDDAARMLQALLGRLGPTGTALAGRPLLEPARYARVGSLDPFTDDTALLADPWDRAYRYAYRVPASGWTNPSFVLWSAGPDGRDVALLATGGYPDPAAADNADNFWANRN